MRRLLTGIVGLCVLGTLHAADLRQSVFRSGIDLVRVYVTVTDGDGHLVTNLDRADFEILDDGRPQPVVAFSNTPSPIRLVLMLDVSGSMSGNAEVLKSGAEYLFTRFLPDDVALVGTFGRVITISSGFTNDRHVLQSALPERIPLGSPTPLWWAVNEGIREFEVPGEARRVILVLSDGKDSFSVENPLSSIFSPKTLSRLRLTQADVTDRAQKNDVMVYGVGMPSAFSPEPPGLAPARVWLYEPDPGLAELARQTGGGYTEISAGQDLGAAFARIADELHGQFLVGFEPRSRDGKVHRIDVKVLRPGMTVRARQSYVAPGGRQERSASSGQSSAPAGGQPAAPSGRRVGGPRVIDFTEIIKSSPPSSPVISLVSPPRPCRPSSPPQPSPYQPSPSPYRPSPSPYTASSPSPLGSSFEDLMTWLSAVEQHEPGAADGSVQTVRSWTTSTLNQVWMDLSSVVTLVRRPDIRTFSTPSLPASVRAPRTRPREPSREVCYNPLELDRLQTIARRLAKRGGANRMLQRGAMLHADIAMLAPPQGAAYEAPGRGGPSPITLNLTDGQQSGFENVSNHWEMGRRLLDQVRPEGGTASSSGPGADAIVRAWYIATSAFMQRAELLAPWHIERALQLLPRDPEMLFFAACFHEALSAPHLQSVLQSKNLPRGVSFDIGAEDDELNEAERLFLQVLEIRPRHIEARIRLGRVLGRLGRHQEAARELREAAMTTEDPLLLYYAHVFLGAEEEALGRTAQARDAYEAAAMLYPHAQSPRLALSTLAARTGDRATAMQLLEPALSRSTVSNDDDPWWIYHTAQARDSSRLLEHLHTLLREGGRP